MTRGWWTQTNLRMTQRYISADAHARIPLSDLALNIHGASALL